MNQIIHPGDAPVAIFNQGRINVAQSGAICGSSLDQLEPSQMRMQRIKTHTDNEGVFVTEGFSIAENCMISDVLIGGESPLNAMKITHEPW